MKQLSSAQVRQMWLDFWATKGHSVEPSVSLVPVNDPTLLWINSGVATLKKYFDGTIIPENPRITNAQKAIRTNDIENVGKTARHHTMFEMLGNFSIGDYFRDEAITWAYELLTSPEWFDFPKEKLYMTYYPADTDSYNRWIEVGVDPSHLIPIEDNFSTSRMIGINRSVSKLVLAPWITATKRSKPAPVSMFLCGNSLYSLRGTAGSALNCDKTMFQISM